MRVCVCVCVCVRVCTIQYTANVRTLAWALHHSNGACVAKQVRYIHVLYAISVRAFKKKRQIIFHSAFFDVAHAIALWLLRIRARLRSLRHEIIISFFEATAALEYLFSEGVIYATTTTLTTLISN